MLFLSKDVQFPGVLVERGGLAAADKLPRASFSVVTPPGSSRALPSIVAASELEKVGGRIGRCLGLCEKNKGEGGEVSFLLGTML
jgi:hypothetical protein